ncbi:TPA: response regulator transcription factor [Burkholderia cenocepacia]|uniref:helix-turn-helix transcriptional regulator n=1 Tax=Burkholderia cenocepacia TaxID=95486 RepID=UPI00075E38FB|nr:LuxR C-terminal-related transcriptional regulator [Burkholderia cenocepacia]KVF56274.1 helix-turn-helix transcriptional regulator [Burkholderia cenocepacia]
MNLTLQDVAWHRSVGRLIETLDQPGFWLSLIRLIEEYVAVDSWVALMFGDGRPQVFAECAYEGGGPDPLFRDYVQGLYLLDPFYIANRDAPTSGLFRLSDVAPECFRDTEYYTRYFTHNVVEDEVQFNVVLHDTRTLCLSLGSKRRFSPEHVALLDLVRPWVAALMRQRLAYEPMLAEPAPSRRPGADAGNGFEHAMARLGTPLTARELDVIRLILSGRSNKEVASKLDISAETVKVHRRNIYAKLAINSQSELFALFLKAQTDT